MNDLSPEELQLIEKEYAPQGVCSCKKLETQDLGCPFCNVKLRSAWKNSRKKELILLFLEKI